VLDLFRDLVFEVARVVLHVVVENEVVGEAGHGKVHEVDAEVDHEDEGEELTGHVVSGPGRGRSGVGEGESCGE
jgi:hypothetical protein